MRQQEARSPVGNVGSRTYHVGENEDSGARRDLSAVLGSGGNDASRVDPSQSSRQNRMRKSNGLEKEVHEGPLFDEEIPVAKETGLDEVMHDITSMVVSLVGVAEPTAGAEIAKVNTLKPNIKTWKRMARRPLEKGLTNRISNRRKRAPGDSQEDEVSHTMKKVKNVEGTQQFAGEILAEAIEQPCQQP
jgi:hypothetical protein